MSKWNKERRKRKAARPTGHLDTFTAVVAHLREVFNGRRRWVFLTDNPNGHRQLVEGAVALTGAGVSDLRYGALEFLNPPTGHRLGVSFLTVAKADLPAVGVNVLMAGWGLSGRTDGEQDVLVLADDKTDGAALYVFCAAVRQGKFSDGTPGVN